MKCFVNQDGKIVDTLGAEHILFAKRSKHRSLKKYLKQAIRVAIYSRAMIYETLQSELTDKQKRALNKLYREYCCFSCNGAINHVNQKQSNNPRRITF